MFSRTQTFFSDVNQEVMNQNPAQMGNKFQRFEWCSCFLSQKDLVIIFLGYSFECFSFFSKKLIRFQFPFFVFPPRLSYCQSCVRPEIFFWYGCVIELSFDSVIQISLVIWSACLLAKGDGEINAFPKISNPPHDYFHSVHFELRKSGPRGSHT